MDNQETTIVNETENENEGVQETAPKTYTQEEVLALIQSETDKRVSQALKTQQKKFDKQMSLSKLDGEAREIAEKDERIAELTELLAQRDVERNKSELKSVLSSRGLSAEFADIILINDDIEASQANIDKLDRLFKNAVKIEVEKRLAGNTPRGNGGTPPELTREAFIKMSLVEQNKIRMENPELYAKLTR